MSVLIFNNDRLHELEKLTLSDVRHRTLSDFSGVSMPWEAHADGYCLMLIGGCEGKVLVSTYDGNRQGPSDTQRIELTLLKELAEKNGYLLRKKPTKKAKKK